MLTPRCIPTLLGVALFAGGVGAEEGREVHSAAGRFTVRLPGKPAEKDQPTPAGTLHALQVRGPSGDWTVSWIDLPAEAKPPTAEARLDAIRKSLAERLRGTVVTQKKVELEKKHPGRDLVLDLGPGRGLLRTRVFLAGNRLYQLTVQGAKEQVESPAAQKVLDSFTLTK
jgi:hypothetical protein